MVIYRKQDRSMLKTNTSLIRLAEQRKYIHEYGEYSGF